MKPWKSRLSWGVVWSSADERASATLIGGNWCEVWRLHGRNTAPGPMLLFRSRSQARAWCEAQHEKYRGRTDSLVHWRFRPVRIRESWEIVS